MNQNEYIQKYTIDKDGFHGHLYSPEKDICPGKAVLVLGGGGMPYKLTMVEAIAFADMGVNALAVGYFNVNGAPKTIDRVPVEYVENAARYLHSHGFDQVIAVGISKGAELALFGAV